MGYSNDNGYVPLSLEDIIEAIMEGFNTVFSTTYTTETFVGSGFYRFSYALAQRIQRNEVRTDEIFLKVQDYFRETNANINDPLVTPTGVIQQLAALGYTASVKPPESGDAGKAYICVNVDDSDEDYAEMKLEICETIRDCIVAGVVTYGTEEETLVLSNGQSFDFKYDLPDVTEILLRLTLTTSRNNQGVIDSVDEIKDKLIDNINARYSLGKDFEPETYFSIADAPWCSDILLEYSIDDGGNWLTAVNEAEYDELYSYPLENVEIVET
jgi:hypothetical protein